MSLQNTSFQVAHGFNALRLIDLIRIRQSDEITSSFYSIEGIRWMAKKETIIKITKDRIEIVQRRYEKQADKCSRDVYYVNEIKYG